MNKFDRDFKQVFANNLFWKIEEKLKYYILLEKRGKAELAKLPPKEVVSSIEGQLLVIEFVISDLEDLKELADE